jgi:small subunit ribosomal protein S20
MANNKSAIKRWHQSLKRRERNRAAKSAARTSARHLREAKASGDEKRVAEALSEAYSAYDLAAKKGAIPKGTADRHKRRLAIHAGRE